MTIKNNNELVEKDKIMDEVFEQNLYYFAAKLIYRIGHDIEKLMIWMAFFRDFAKNIKISIHWQVFYHF